ncbi:hypothetical protein NPIL_494351 [Nephila pilipes]|uniref:Uncharacterized protein n=1 Tax=Nephila pilipes TaxID=299642 RepID=A0A8X6NE69_NEPPI|nr:hypothetical protein NPIL_494351 [Nephila pilipes]
MCTSLPGWGIEQPNNKAEIACKLHQWNLLVDTVTLLDCQKELSRRFFHQGMSVMEQIYKGKWPVSMRGDFC